MVGRERTARTAGAGMTGAARAALGGATLALALGAAAARAEPGMATWTTYLYEGPGWHYSVMTEVTQAQQFDVLACADGWCKISYDKSVGFVPAEVVVKGTESALDPPKGVLAQPAAEIVQDPKGPCFPANQKGGNGGNAMTWFCEK